LATLAAAQMGLRRRYAVVQVHNPPDFLLLASIGPRLLGAGTVLDIHDLSPDMFAMRFAERPGARAADRVLRLVERWAVRVAGIVLTVHEPYRRELIDRGARGDRTIVVMNSIDERLLPAEAPAEDAGFRVVYHGTITPHYGVGLLVEAAAEIGDSIPGLRVELYGAGDALADIQARARSLGIAAQVIASPEFLDQREVLERVAGASVGVIPNLPTRLNRYALSTKLLEYVALGIPVACAGLPTLREHFSDEEVLFFRPGDASDLARVLLEVAADPVATSARVAAARRRAAQYSWSDNAARYVDALDRARRA
ncbi:MAG: glycosyltransferase, partial [Actinobacteria bacterium]|nr:glycosyltransferase [Actinomycetota bacterium]